MNLYHSSAYDTSQPVPSYWEASAKPLDAALRALNGPAIADVAILGAGYTGLSAARRLASVHGLDVAVIDAGAPGWGASGRNGGFCSSGSAKRSWPSLLGEFGHEETVKFHRMQRDAVEHVRELVSGHPTGAGIVGGGELTLAHKPSRIEDLKRKREFMQSAFGEKLLYVPREELAGRGYCGPHFHGGLHDRISFGLHPLNYVRELARMALEAGVRIHSHSMARAHRYEAGRHVLVTANGELRAKKLLVATNGYTRENLPPWISGRLLPALSRILVTRPLNEAELRAQGWTGLDPAADTRNLLHYFRLLPDRRFLFGGRGGLDASPTGLARGYRQLRTRFEAFFPAWANVETEYSWSGFVCLAASLTPYSGPLGDLANAWGAFAWHGNGVAMGSLTGHRMADVISGARTLEDAMPAIMRKPLRQFPLPFLRIAGLAAAYAGCAIADEWF